MKCLRCGKEIKDQNVFCQNCLNAMEAYPVKPDTHFYLPSHTVRSVPKKNRRKKRVLSSGEQLTLARHTVRGLTVAVIVLSLLLVGAAALLIHDWLTPTDLDIGRNYTFQSTEN